MIAIVDTGADVSTPALAAKSPITWNVVTGMTAVTDATGHGTLVASLAGRFGGDARLMIVQANRGGSGFSTADEAAGIVWAVDHGANIVNLSFGGPAPSGAEQAAIDYASAHGALVVAAAGSGTSPVYPAASVGPDGLVVGACTQDGKRASYSSTSPYVDVLAPGSYASRTGTSYAAPEVAGAAALVWAANPKLTAAEVAATIERTESKGGLLDVAAAVVSAG
jgi:subtilisin family serine protease